MFFRKMNEQEKENSRRGMVVGFITYMLITAVNYMFYLITDAALLSPAIIFWVGLLASFGFEAAANFRGRKSGVA